MYKGAVFLLHDGCIKYEFTNLNTAYLSILSVLEVDLLFHIETFVPFVTQDGGKNNILVL
jgi:hypothetical protein